LLKRFFWMLVGIGFGFGMSFWLTRLIREKVARWSPENVSADLSRALRDLGKDLRAAVSEGAQAMRERETELREHVESSSSQ
jgi:ATP-dependent RNA circularization protein (DNA/RNA ligase family)